MSICRFVNYQKLVKLLYIIKHGRNTKQTPYLPAPSLFVSFDGHHHFNLSEGALVLTLSSQLLILQIYHHLQCELNLVNKHRKPYKMGLIAVQTYPLGLTACKLINSTLLGLFSTTSIRIFLINYQSPRLLNQTKP